MNREKAFEILKKYNQEEFHIRHALTVEGVMKYFAKEYGEDEEYWGIIGLLHDIDFEEYPEEHCKKCIDILNSENYPKEVINSICSHGYGMHNEIKPEHEMEKILYTTDELTGIIFAAAKMRPSKSTKDMELPSLKKKFKDKKFAAGCSRDIIRNGAEMLGWEMDEVLGETLNAMKESEDQINDELENLE